MDRLPALALVAALAACSEEPGDAGTAMTRVAAVRETGPVAAPESWCEVSFAPAEAPALELPPLAPGNAFAPAPGRWTWLNLWATWCVPCIREMEVLRRWKDRLAKDGVQADFWFLSLDEDEAALAQFLASRPGFLPGRGIRAASQDAVQTWFGGLRLAASTAIPVQVIAAPNGRVRCVRVGGLNDADYRLVRGLMQGF